MITYFYQAFFSLVAFWIIGFLGVFSGIFLDNISEYFEVSLSYVYACFFMFCIGFAIGIIVAFVRDHNSRY